MRLTTNPTLAEVLILLVLVVILATALGYASQFLAVLSAPEVLTPTQIMVRNMAVGVVTITTILLALIVAGLVWAASATRQSSK